MKRPQASELEQIENVTANYFFWQGLRWVPMGVALLVIGLSYSTWWPLGGAFAEAVPLGALAAALAASYALGPYYERAFGRVRSLPEMHRRRETLKWFLWYPLMGASLAIDIQWKPRLFVSGVVWAGGVVAYWWSTGRGREHYLVVAACMAAFTFLPITGSVAPGKATANAFVCLLGVAFILGGLLDHVALGRVLRPVEDGGDDEGSV